MAIILGFLLILAGFILFTVATVRVQAFRRSLRVGLFTFVIPRCWVLVLPLWTT